MNTFRKLKNQTVGELIAVLKTYPPDMDIRIDGYDTDFVCQHNSVPIDSYQKDIDSGNKSANWSFCIWIRPLP